MSYYERNKAGIKRYLAKLDEIKLRLPRGAKTEIQSAAAAAGQSVNQYIQDAILARIGIDRWPRQGGE